MAWAPSYVDAEDLAEYVRISDDTDDALLTVAAAAASRAIDAFCGRQFGKVDAAAARTYTWGGEYLDGRQALSVDDIHDTTDLAVKVLDADGGTVATLASADFDLWPWNASADGRPWTHIVLRSGAAPFPSHARGVQVTALFGWADVPDLVQQAALIQASRLFARRLSPFGIAGSPDLGSELRLLARIDADVAVLLSSLRRTWGAA